MFELKQKMKTPKKLDLQTLHFLGLPTQTHGLQLRPVVVRSTLRIPPLLEFLILESGILGFVHLAFFLQIEFRNVRT